MQERQYEMLLMLRELVETESPSNDKAAVDRLGALLATRFEGLGGRVKVHRVADFGNHLQVDFTAHVGKPVMLLGHFDTVWNVGTLQTMPFRLHDQRAFGPGVLDMKSGIVLMLFALQALQKRGGLPRPITVFLNTDEEVGSTSSQALVESLAKRSSAVLVLEPAQGLQGAVKTARKGVGDYNVIVRGKAAHAGLDFEKGENAIVELARQVERISGFTELSRGLTVSVGVIRGGTRSNVIPAEASAEVDVRINSMKDAARIEKKFRSLKPINKQCKLEILGGINRPPMERTTGVAALYNKARTLAAELGWKLDEAAVGGGSDGNFTAALGVPTLDGLGGVGEGAHAVNESILVEELPRRAALLARLIEAV
jgi:glutamate carboxypeptidase